MNRVERLLLMLVTIISSTKCFMCRGLCTLVLHIFKIIGSTKGNTELNTFTTEVMAMVNTTVSKSDAAGKNYLAIQKTDNVQQIHH